MKQLTFLAVYIAGIIGILEYVEHPYVLMIFAISYWPVVAFLTAEDEEV